AGNIVIRASKSILLHCNKLHWILIGPRMPAPLPIVLIPGLNCSAQLYAENTPTRWQFGPVQVADHTRADSMDAIAADILANAPPRFALAGLSMGGYIALTMLRQAPARVSKLALLDTSA